MKLTRRGLFGLIAAIPLAGIGGFRPERVLTYVPLHMDRLQMQANWLFEAHLENVRRSVMLPARLVYSDRMVEAGEAFANERDRRIKLVLEG